MVVVKADGYGHGMLPAARAALAGGATWLGVANLDEALALRDAGLDAPVLAWLWTLDEGDLLREALAAGVDVGVSTLAQLDAVHDAAASSATARVHLKVDTGLSRNGASRRRLAGPGRGRRDAAGGRHGRRRRRLEPPRPRRRAGRADHGPADRGVRRRPRRGRGRGSHPALASPGQLGGPAHRARHPLRPGAGRHRRLRPGPGRRRYPRFGAPARDDAARAGRCRQAGARGHRRLLRPPLRDDDGHHPRAGAGRLRRRRAAGGVGPVAGAARGAGVPCGRPGVHGPVRPRRRRPRRPRGRRGRAVRRGRRRAPGAGPRCSTRSTTRS